MALNQENEEMHTVKLCGDGENQGQDHSLKNGKHHGTDQRADPNQGRDRESERNNAPSAKEDQRTVLRVFDNLVFAVALSHPKLKTKARYGQNPEACAPQ